MSQLRSHSRWGKALVMAQIALSILLLVTAGLFGRTLINLRSVNVGFDPDRLLLFASTRRRRDTRGEPESICFCTFSSGCARFLAYRRRA